MEKIFIHPDYNYPSVINNDIAVLKLQTPIQFNKYVSPVCLPDNDVPVGTECYITGQFLKIHFRFSIDDPISNFVRLLLPIHGSMHWFYFYIFGNTC